MKPYLISGHLTITDLLKEAQAITNTLGAIPEKVRNRRVDIKVDQAVVKAWENQGGKDPNLDRLMKQLFQTVTRLNCEIKLMYIPSKQNPADVPSRHLSRNDACLSSHSWHILEGKYGPST